MKAASAEQFNIKWIILLTMSLALAMIFIDQTAVSVTLPTIQRDLHLTATALQWIINAYLLALAALIILGGKLGDIFGHKYSFVSGITIFALGSLLIGISNSLMAILVGRVIQGLGGAFIIPSSTLVVMDQFEFHERGKAIGSCFAIGSIFLVAGPAIGGFISQSLGWRWIFLLNVPVSVLITLLTITLVANSQVFKPKLLHSIDWLGSVALSLSMLGIIFGLMETSTLGWGSSIVLISLSTGILSLFAFVKIERSSTKPLIDLNIFTNPLISKSLLLLVIAQGTIICVVFWSLYLQYELNTSPAQTGLMLLPAFAPIPIMSFLSGKIFDASGVRMPLVTGSSLLCLSIGYLAYVAQFKSYWLILPSFILFGIAIPLIISSASTSAIIYTEASKRGAIAGLTAGSRQFGGALAIAIIGTLITHVSHDTFNNTIKGSQLLTAFKHGQWTFAQLQTQHFDINSPSKLMVKFQGLLANAYLEAFIIGMVALAVLCLFAIAIAYSFPKTKPSGNQ